MQYEKVQLSGKFVRLEPLGEQHREGLIRAIEDGKLWELFVTSVPHPEDIDAFFAQADKQYQQGAGLAFATIDIASNSVVGSTRFMQASGPDKRVEIGHTFIASSFQKTRINTEAKLLMLRHAFEELGLNRVEFHTDYLNTASRNAILRLGAKQEAILRSHRVMPDGRVRDSVVFSILAHEWGGVKRLLEFKLSR